MDNGEQLRLHLRFRLAGVGGVTLTRLVESFGSLRAAGEAPVSRLKQVEGIGDKTAAAIAAVTDADVDEELALAAREGAAILCRDDAAYPAALTHLYDPPPVLYVMGQLSSADAVAVAVVGSRRCTHYGLEQADRFGGLLGRAGFTVVSGGARGIDIAAHRGAMESGGRTIAVMGSGLCHLYPPENVQLFRRIVDSGRGAVVGELPMRTAVLAGSFPTRNRIIAALSLGVLVIEAALRSGSLITARLAVEQGKDVFALPGRVDSPFSQGTNKLIRDGSAALVQNLDDILESLGRVGQVIRDAGGAERPRPKLAMDPTEAALAAQLAGTELTIDELIRRTGLPANVVTAAMTMLAIKGAVVQKPGGLFAAKN